MHTWSYPIGHYRTLVQNIVLAKLRPGQEIDMDLHAIKGVGKDHAKWSPVGMQGLLHPRPQTNTIVSHRLLPPPSPHHTQPIKSCPSTPLTEIRELFQPWGRASR